MSIIGLHRVWRRNRGVVWLLPAGFDTVLVEEGLRELSGPGSPADEFLHGGRFGFFGWCGGDCGGAGGAGSGRRFLALVCAGFEVGFLWRHCQIALLGGSFGSVDV